MFWAVAAALAAEFLAHRAYGYFSGAWTIATLAIVCGLVLTLWSRTPLKLAQDE